MADVFKQGSTGAGGSGAIVVNLQGKKPAYLASLEADDPSVIALADTIFWSDQFSEHAQFIALLLPVGHLARERDTMLMYAGAFETLYQDAKKCELNKDRIASLSERMVEQTRQLIDYEKELESRQRSGQLQSLAWPTFLDHTAYESDRFIDRQQALTSGHLQNDREDTIRFWAQIMAQHAEFVAHLLDPGEGELFNQALQSSKDFWNLQNIHPLEGNHDPVLAEVQKMIDFKAAAAQGIEAGQIQSIIAPALADHVRREALLFLNELEQADKAMNVQLIAA